MAKNHFTATGIVFNSKKEVLMIFHKKFKLWLLPGGHIDENELPTEAVLREVFEETGVRASLIPNKRGVAEHSQNVKELDLPFTAITANFEGDKSYNICDMTFLCRALNTDLTPQENEVDSVGWFSIEQASKLKTFDDIFPTIVKALEYLDNNPEYFSEMFIKKEQPQ